MREPHHPKGITMNKFTKASIATGAGIVLLLGGAGTFALWNDDAAVDAGTIQSGVLTLDEGTVSGAWYRVVGTVDGTSIVDDVLISDIADYRIVPGDKLVYKVSGLTVTARGDNLKAKLGFGPALNTISTFPDSVTVAVSSFGTLPGGVTSDADGTIHIQPGTGTTDLTLNNIAVVVDFDDDAANNTQTKQLDLSTLSFTLDQVLSF
jgi:alternate signal-mediated exported protein